MLIRIEEGNHDNHWIVRLDDYPVTCRNWREANEFAERMKSRLDAPHSLVQRPRQRVSASTATPTS